MRPTHPAILQSRETATTSAGTGRAGVATGARPVRFSIPAAGLIIADLKINAPNSTTPPTAINPQTPIHPAATIPALIPGAKQTPPTASTAPKGCKICAADAKLRATPDSNPPTPPHPTPPGTNTNRAHTKKQ